MGQRSKTCIAICAVALLIAVGCGKRQSETDKKLAELQAQLEEQKKQLEQARAAEQTPAPARQEPAAGAAKGAATSGKPGGSASAKQGGTNSESSAANKSAIEANKAAIATNKNAIAPNKGNIEKNAANIETNRQGVEEAKKMAAPAPYHTIPVGTQISFRTGPAISTKTSASGSLFEATLTEPLSVDGGDRGGNRQQRRSWWKGEGRGDDIGRASERHHGRWPQTTAQDRIQDL